MQTVKNNPKTINAWAFFDWANSAYALTISSAIFPGYFLSVTDSEIHIGNWTMSNSSLYAYTISFAYILVAIASPALSGIADFGGKKKMFLKFFTGIGSLACIFLFLFKDMSDLSIGTICFMIATIGFTGSLVFYNAYLPEIATEDQYDRVSAKGFVYGYIGSVLLLIINLVVILHPGWFGISNGNIAVRLAFVMVGIWWYGFSRITFQAMPADRTSPLPNNLLSHGFNEIKLVWAQLQGMQNTKRFLFAFFFYNMGVQTVLYLAATFASKEIAFSTTELIILILILQIVAIGGALLFARVSKWKGSKFSIVTMLCIWILVCICAYFVKDKLLFYGVAAIVGLVMGGIQAMSRSAYSKLIPQNRNDNAGFYSFYDVVEKVAIVLGTFSFGFIENITGGIRNSVLALILFFVIGLWIIRSCQFSAKEIG